MFGHTSAEAQFEIDGIEYVAGFGEMAGKSIFGFVALIDGKWRENDVGQGNELLVFATIMDIISEFVLTKNPDELVVGGVPERERIYAKMLKRKEPAMSQAGYELSGPESDNWPGYGQVSMFTIKKAEA